ncbi:MAG: hypothetical protein ACJAV4_000850 [Pontimonas sp.]
MREILPERPVASLSRPHGFTAIFFLAENETMGGPSSGLFASGYAELLLQTIDMPCGLDVI